jgi:hypothetical protein
MPYCCIYVCLKQGQGHYSSVEEPTCVEGDIKGENIRWIASRTDTILAISGNSRAKQLCMQSLSSLVGPSTWFIHGKH